MLKKNKKKDKNVVEQLNYLKEIKRGYQDYTYMNRLCYKKIVFESISGSLKVNLIYNINSINILHKIHYSFHNKKNL